MLLKHLIQNKNNGVETLGYEIIQWNVSPEKLEYVYVLKETFEDLVMIKK